MALRACPAFSSEDNVCGCGVDRRDIEGGSELGDGDIRKFKTTKTGKQRRKMRERQKKVIGEIDGDRGRCTRE
jgi:hypothetical protein